MCKQTLGVGCVLALLGILTLPSTSGAQQNTNIAKAVPIPTDGTALGGYVTGSAGSLPLSWYVAKLFGGRSYSIQVTPQEVSSTNASGTTRSSFVQLSLYAQDGTTFLSAARFTSDDEPAVRYGPIAELADAWQGSYRYSYTPVAAVNVPEYVFARVNPWVLSNAGDYAYFKVTAVDTTLYCAWYYTSADYESFTEISNNTSTNVAITMTHYNRPSASGGAVAVQGAPVTFNLVPFATTLVLAKGSAGVTPGMGGSARITHDGPPGAIRANITTINATGIGLTHAFNVPCGSR